MSKSAKISYLKDKDGNFISPVTDVSSIYDNGTKIKIPDLLSVYPVGSIYLSVDNTNPGTLFGGTWEQLKDRFLLGAGSTYTNGSTGGEATHKLIESELPKHKHVISCGGNMLSVETTINNPAMTKSEGFVSGVNSWYANSNKNAGTLNNTGGDAAHNNMPPYLVVYMWKRTK